MTLNLVLCLILCCMTLDDIEKMSLELCLGFEKIGYPGFEGGWKKKKGEEIET